MTDKKIDWEALEEFSNAMREASRQYEAECDEYWKNLPYEDQLRAFYSVMKRVHQGELIDKGTYRWVLYDVFGFGPEAYSIGMDCGFMELHNSIDSKIYGD